MTYQELMNFWSTTGLTDFYNHEHDEKGRFTEEGTTATKPEPGQPSDVLKIYGTSYTKDSARAAVAAIESVHGLPKDQYHPVLFNEFSDRTGGLWGEYTVTADNRPQDISVNSLGSHLELTTTHEFGHYIDDRRFIQKTDVLPTIKASFDYKQLLQEKGHEMGYVDYLLNDKETFARAYAQYVATRSGNEKLQSQVESIRNEFGAKHNSQWDAKDFEPIAEAFDKAFADKGLLKSSKQALNAAATFANDCHDSATGRFCETGGGYQPDPTAPDEGEFVRDADGNVTSWRQSHRRLIVGALSSWKGDPVDMNIHMRDAKDNAPQPSSGTGKKWRAEAEALLWEIHHNGRPNTKTLYRGAETNPKGLEGWSELKSVAKGFQKKGQNASLYTIPKGQAQGIRIEDYIHSQLTHSEREWIVDSTGHSPAVLASAAEQLEFANLCHDEAGRFCEGTGTGTNTATAEPDDGPILLGELDDSNPQGAARVREALAAISKVHTIPADLPTVLVKEGGTGDALGLYTPESTEIHLEDPHDMFTFVHEFGHHLSLVDGGPVYSTTEPETETSKGKLDFLKHLGDAGLGNWYYQVTQSPEFKRQFDREGKGDEYASYLKNPKELFARSYAQYIATRSGNSTLRDQFERWRFKTDANDVQWTDTSFEPIGNALDEFFSAKHLTASALQEFANPCHDAKGEFCETTGGAVVPRASDTEQALALKRAKAKIKNALIPPPDKVIKHRAALLKAEQEGTRAGGEFRGNSTDRKHRQLALWNEFGGPAKGYLVDAATGVKMSWTKDPKENPDHLPVFTQGKVFTGHQGGSYTLDNLIPELLQSNQARGDAPVRKENLQEFSAVTEEFSNPYHDQQGRFTDGPTSSKASKGIDLAELVKPEGGATIDPRSGQNVTTGYAVAVDNRYSSITKASEFFSGPKGQEKGRQILKDWIKQNKNLFTDPSIKIGLWHDSAHGEIVIDASQQVMDRNEALRLGQERDQQGIYDLSGKEGYIETGGSGGRETAAA